MFNCLRSHLTKRLVPFAAARITNSRICNVSTNTNALHKDGFDIFYLQARVIFLEESVHKRQNKIIEHEKAIEELTGRVYALDMEYIGRLLRNDRYKEVFPAHWPEDVFEPIREMVDILTGNTDFKLTELELTRWEKFVSEINRGGCRIEQPDPDIDAMIDSMKEERESKDVSTTEEAVPKD